MANQIENNEDNLKLAQHPHQVFLFNMVGIHILLSIITLSNSTFLEFTLAVPTISLLIISYLFARGRKLKNHHNHFVSWHWGIALKRLKILLIAYGFAICAALLAWLVHNVMPIKEMAYAIIGGLGILPTMSVVLFLTVIESETLNKAINGQHNS